MIASSLGLADQIERDGIRSGIADYAKGSYFKHLRLYDYVLNNKQMSEVKRIQLKRNEPKVALSLDAALLLGAELAQV